MDLSSASHRYYTSFLSYIQLDNFHKATSAFQSWGSSSLQHAKCFLQGFCLFMFLSLYFFNFLLWFTVRYLYPSLSSELYPFQQSDIILVPGLMYFLITGDNGLADLSLTTSEKHLLRSILIPPKAQTPSTHFPL